MNQSLLTYRRLPDIIDTVDKSVIGYTTLLHYTSSSIESIFYQLFKNIFEKQDQYNMVKLSELPCQIFTGSETIKRGENNSLREYVLTIENLSNRFVMAGYESAADQMILDDDQYVSQNDLVMINIGNRIGEAALIDVKEKYKLAKQLTAIRIENHIYSSYLVYYLSSPRVKAFIDRMTYGVSLPKIKSIDIANIMVHIPNLDSLNEFNDHVKYIRQYYKIIENGIKELTTIHTDLQRIHPKVIKTI